MIPDDFLSVDSIIAFAKTMSQQMIQVAEALDTTTVPVEDLPKAIDLLRAVHDNYQKAVDTYAEKLKELEARRDEGQGNLPEPRDEADH